MYELYQNQKIHVENLRKSLEKYSRVLDTSETGTGKTYTSVFVCKQENLIPFIICPKIVIYNWKKVLNNAEIKKYFITSYEKFHNLKYHDEQNIEHEFKLIKKKKIKKDNENIISYEYDESVDIEDNKNKIIIYDEVHKCKNINTINSKILLELTKIKNIKLLLLSATLLDRHTYFIHVGYVLKIYDSVQKGRMWLNNIIKKYGHGNEAYGIFMSINNIYASRMKLIDCLGDNIFQNDIYTRCEKMDSWELIEKEYENINIIVKQLQENKKKANVLSRILFCRQQIELLKIPTFIKLTNEYIENGNSVVIFVNFTQTLLNLATELNTDCICYGGISEVLINKNINDFVENKKRVIICNIKKSTIGISLHDTIGNFPRISLISPTWSAIELLQAFGRIYRSGIKSHSKQYILFCSNTYEEKIAENIKAKIKNIAMFNDGNCLSYKIEGFKYDNVNCSILQENFYFDAVKSKKKNKANNNTNINTNNNANNNTNNNTKININNNDNGNYNRYFTNTYKVTSDDFRIKSNTQLFIKADDKILSNMNKNIYNSTTNKKNQTNSKNQISEKIDIIADDIEKLNNRKKILENNINSLKLLTMLDNDLKIKLNELKTKLNNVNETIEFKINELTTLCVS
jgi:superfamily II DNA or RNA helicase